MIDKNIDRQVEVLSGKAEEKLQQERIDIIRQQTRERDARQARKFKLAEMADNPANLLPTVAALSAHERKHYSIANAVQALVREPLSNHQF